MSQLGMQMPGAQRSRAGSPNVYAGLMLAAVACLLTALIFVMVAGSRVGPGGSLMGAFRLHTDGRLDLGR